MEKKIEKEASEPTLQNLSTALTKRGFKNEIYKDSFIVVNFTKDQKIGYALSGLEMLFKKRIFKTNHTEKSCYLCFYL